MYPSAIKLLVPLVLGLFLVACGQEQVSEPDQPAVIDDGPRHPMIIRPHRADAPLVSYQVDPVSGERKAIACATCHDTRQPNLANAAAADLDEFHQGLQTGHGGLNCLSCHNAADYGSLRRADGQSLDFADAMQLCGQCHGAQYGDYQQGVHGGMQGHWDRRRGSQLRNSCLSCHDPHKPAYPQVNPLPPPTDGAAPAGAHHD